jgi:hypothetical protein
MSKLSSAALVVIVVVLAGLCLPLLVAQGRQPAPQPAAPARMPPGPAQETAEHACTLCHDAGIVVQQRLSKDAWGKEVDKMTRWGAPVDANERDGLVDYLSANFPADKRPDPPTRVPAGK